MLDFGDVWPYFSEAHQANTKILNNSHPTLPLVLYKRLKQHMWYKCFFISVLNLIDTKLHTLSRKIKAHLSSFHTQKIDSKHRLVNISRNDLYSRETNIISSWVVDFHTERLLRLLLQVVHIDQNLHWAGTLAGGESQSDGVTLSPADLNTMNTTQWTCLIFIWKLCEDEWSFFFSSASSTKWMYPCPHAQSPFFSDNERSFFACDNSLLFLAGLFENFMISFVFWGHY